MDRYAIALGKVPIRPIPLVISDDPRKIYYLGAMLSFGRTSTSAVICHERTNGTIEIDHTEARPIKFTNEISAWFQDLNKRFPIRYGLINFSEKNEKINKINFDFNSEIITRRALNSDKIDEFYDFWIGFSNADADMSLRGATKLSFWALHETLTRDIPDLYTNKNKFNEHLKKIQGNVKGPKVKLLDSIRGLVRVQGLTGIQGARRPARHATHGITGIMG